MLSSIEHCPCNFTWVSFQEVSFVASTIQEFERLQLQMQTLFNDILDHRQNLDIRQKSEKIKHMSIMEYQSFKFHHSYAKLQNWILHL